MAGQPNRWAPIWPSWNWWKKGQWSSTKAMGNYLHGNDAGKLKAQLKRIAKRRTRVWSATLVKV